MTRADGGASRQRLGAHGEALAAEFLERNGLRLLERRFRRRHGEIDLIARHGALIVFVEVKTRRGLGFGAPAAAVTPAKQRRMARTALGWLAARGWHERPCRFDVVEILDRDEGPEIRHLPDAFRP